MPNTILVVDDETDILEFIKYNLEQNGFNVLIAENGMKALELLEQNPDLLLLDIMMPGIDGFEVCKRVRLDEKYKHIPVIMLTAKNNETNEIKGLELGADDFIAKPVSIKKLLARIKSNLRQSEFSNQNNSQKNIEVGPIIIDREKFVVNINGKNTFFPRKEFELIHLLAINRGKVISRSEILKRIWGEDIFVIDRTIDVHVRKIREKLGEYSNLIETVKGVGYRFKGE